MQISERIRELSNELEQHTIEIRHKIHACPELSFHEFKTSELVCSELKRMGIPFEKSPCAPGVIGTIDSGRPGKFLMLRADMDALPIQEKTGLEFASQVPNVMHACGHDVHTANLLAVAEILNRTKDQWNGKVKVVFQPAEENGGGGREMIKAGLMNELPDACFALHIKPGFDGCILSSKRYLSAYSDSYTLLVHGRAAHSSTPEVGADAIYIAASIVTALHGIISRNISPMDRATINIGTIQGGTAPNIIADEVKLGVMLRNLSRESREAMCSKIEKVASGVAEAMGGSCEFNFRAGYPAVFNDEVFTDFVEAVLEKNGENLYDGLADGRPERWLRMNEEPLLGAEDFGFFSQKAPSCMIWVGVGGDAPLHNPEFHIDERYMKLCTRAMATVAIEYLVK